MHQANHSPSYLNLELLNRIKKTSLTLFILIDFPCILQWIKCLAQGQNIVDLQDVESKNRLQLHVVVLIVLVYQRKHHHSCIKLISRTLNSPSYLNLELLNSMKKPSLTLFIQIDFPCILQWIKCLAQGQNIVDLQDVESKNRLQLHVVVLIVLVYQRKHHHSCIKLISRMLNSPSYLNLELLNSMKKTSLTLFIQIDFPCILQWIKCLAQGRNIVDLQDVESKNRLQLHVVVLIVLVYQRKHHHPCIKLIRRMLNSPSYLNLELLNSMKNPSLTLFILIDFPCILIN